MARVQVCCCFRGDRSFEYIRDLSKIVEQDSELKKRLDIKNISACSQSDVQELNGAEIVLGDNVTIAKCLPHLKQVKWMHSIWAGVDPILREIRKLELPHDLLLTRTGGILGPPMAEYVIGYVIALERSFFLMRENQKLAEWIAPNCDTQRALSQLSIGILGVGDIGRCIAEKCKKLEMTTWGLVRTKPTENIPFVDHCRTTSNLEELLRECDYICNVLPSTPETIGLLSGDVLKCCKEKCPVLINLGRADIMDEEALAKAISRRWVSKAVLDVFAVEPLPKDSQLWTMPEVFITPHMSGPTLVHEACVKFLKYLKLYLEGKTLPYAVDFHHGY